MKIKTQSTLAFFSICTIILLVSYQNCGMKTGDLTTQEAGKGTTSGVFPYEINVDNIAFMSCLSNGMNSAPPDGAGQYFSFQLMSRNPDNRSGLKLSAPFYAKYGTNQINLEAGLNKIARTGELKDWSRVNLKFSVLDKANFSSSVHLDSMNSMILSNTVAMGAPNNLTNFTNQSWLAPAAVLPLLMQKTQIDFRALGNYRDGNQILLDMMTKFYNGNSADLAGYALGVHYSMNGFPVDTPRAPSMFGNTVDLGFYGSIFELAFEGNTRTPTGLTAIHEFNAETGKTVLAGNPNATERPGAWTCNHNYKYKIVEYGDAACSSSPFVDLASSNLSGEYALLRDVLGQQWKAFIGADGTRCIQHKSMGGCYYRNNDGTKYPVAYNATVQCSPNYEDTVGSNSGLAQCPRYLSICEKTGN